MAGICNDANDFKRIQFQDVTGKRRTMRLGKMTRGQAELIGRHVDEIVNSQLTGYPMERTTAQWLKNLTGPLLDKFVKFGLVENVNRSLKEFLDEYLDLRKAEITGRTKIRMDQTFKKLFKFFGEAVSIRQLSRKDADKFREWLLVDCKLAEATQRKHCQRARQYWSWGVKRGYLEENIFDHIKTAAVANEERLFYVSKETMHDVMKVLPDPEWKLILALCRIAGLRNPSETFSLKWDDINWAENRMTVWSQKTRRYGKGSRVIPIFEELQPYIKDVQAKASGKSDYVLERYQGQEKNLRTRFRTFIENAGHTPWPRAFHNLRASAVTDAAERYPSHLCSAWFGHTEAIARKHYLMATDEWFDRAAGKVTQGVAQKAAQPMQVYGDPEPQYVDKKSSIGLHVVPDRARNTPKGIRTPVFSMKS